MLKDRNFIFLWSATVMATLATELFAVTVVVLVFQETSSTLQAAGVMVAQTLPSLFLGPIAGVVVDRFRRRNVLIIMDIFRAMVIGAAALWLSVALVLPVAGIYLLMICLASADIFHHPARLALIPSLAKKEDLVRANSIILVSSQIAMALSYVIGGWLVLTLALANISVILMVLFGLSILAALAMRVPLRTGEQDDSAPVPFWKSLLEGWRYLRSHDIARPLTIMEAVEHIPHGVWTAALMLAFTFHALNGDATDWGFQTSAFFSGMITGSLLALFMGALVRRYPGRFIIVNSIVSGVLTLIYAAAGQVWFAVALAFAFGPAFAIRDVAQDSLLQATVDEHHLGRVYATRDALRTIVFMLSGILFAWLSDLVSIRWIFAAAGLLYLLTAGYIATAKSVRESRLDLEPGE